MDYDVVVVGAGLAGLRCAERVAAAGRTVAVLEAGRRRGRVVNTAVVSNAAPTYAPPGRHLVQVTCLLEREAASPASEAQVRRQAGEMYGVSAAPWQLVRRDDVVDALPGQPPRLWTRSDARTSTGAFVCGDHRDTASIQGALVSGDRVATAVLAALAGASAPRPRGRPEPLGARERQERR